MGSVKKNVKLLFPIVHFFEASIAYLKITFHFVSGTYSPLGRVHTYPDIFASATFSFRIRLPSTRIRRIRQRIRKKINPLSRVEKNKAATNPITCGRVNPGIFFIRWRKKRVQSLTAAPWLRSRWIPDTQNKHGCDHGITWRGIIKCKSFTEILFGVANAMVCLFLWRFERSVSIHSPTGFPF